MKLLVDGVLAGAADYSAAISANSDPIIIGSAFNGMIDELQISAIARDPDWLKTAYNNQSNCSTFLSIGAETTVASYFESVLAVAIPDNPDYAPGYKWQAKACDDDGDCTAWEQFNAVTPNFKVDTTLPSAPGQLTENSKTSNTITFNFGAETDEDNFSEYRIYYSLSEPLSEADTLYGSTTNANLIHKNYNGASTLTINNLNPNTTYYFSIWAYDVVGHRASSTVTAVKTNEAISTPGIMFYAKNDQAIYYREWTGTAWGSEQTSGDITAAGDNIRHIRSIRSDNGAKIGLLIKTWDGVNQDWYGAVYRYGANDFVNVSALGTSWASAAHNDLLTACIAPLSGGEFFIVRNNNAGNGAIAFSWDALGGWTSEGLLPGTDATGKFGVMNGCNLVRRPNTDNYLLLTFDDAQYVGSMYYYGGAIYDNASGAWTAWTDHSGAEEDINNFVGDAYFDPSSNARGAIYYSNSAANNYAYAKYFTCGADAINFGGSQPSPAVTPADWGNDFVHGEFAPDPGGTGIAYFAGRDISGELNVYKVDASTPTIAWSAPANGDNISSGDLYSQANNAQKPFAAKFYKNGKGLVVGNYASAAAPFYSIITPASNTVSATSSVAGAAADIYARVMLYDDPNEDELLAIFQNDDIDYAAVFWDPGNEQFYNSGNQAWYELANTSGAADKDDEASAYAYTKFNSAPLSPQGLEQYKTNGTTSIANSGWTDESTVKFSIAALDADTKESITIYLQLIANGETFATATDPSLFNGCAATAAWGDCLSKIWTVASSSLNDYSVQPFTATATITSLAPSTLGYKWQAIACDDEGDCSAWQKFNASAPNFYVDTEAPSAPGNLEIYAKTSQSISLKFGAPTNEPDASFSEYKIFYKAGATGAAETDTPWTQADDAHLASRTYGGAVYTVVNGLSSSTEYVFNIWAYDKAGNKTAALAEIATSTSALPAIRQSSFIWQNDDGANVNANTAAAAASSTLSDIKIGERLALRIQIENIGGDAKMNNLYKLQFENSGTWEDVGATSSISYGLGLAGANNAVISTSSAEANSKIWHNGAWHENTNLSGQISLEYNEYTELVFMINTAYATTSKNYRLRLYDASENKVLADYAKYPALATASENNIRYSKGLAAALPVVKTDMEYYLDPRGYLAIAADDGAYDTAASGGTYPVFLFATKHINNTDAASAIWNGQSSFSTAASNVVLQVFRFGAVNNWETIDTEALSGANLDFSLSGTINSALAEYYDADNWVYWRVYQASGALSLRADYFSASFAPPVPDVSQLHYRWRADDGDEESANWLESEDAPSPILGAQIGKGSTTRLRFSAANTGGGDAENYNYRLEYAISSVGCASDPGGWIAVPVSYTSEHFNIIDSAYFADSATTTGRLANDEEYDFVSGDMVESPSNVSAGITLPEERYTEIEYALEVTANAADAQTYCFRITDDGSALDAYGIYAQVTLSGNTNIAPAFSILPADNDDAGASSSTSPTAEGTEVEFRATAGDEAGDLYYLAICKAPGISAGNDAPPACTGGAWCVSAAAASGTEAVCATTTSSAFDEVNDWYAYACDKVSGYGLAKCSAYSQGEGADGYASPFVVNRAPVFSAVITVEDNKNPGQTFRVSANVADDDTAGGADTLDFYVCASNSASYESGCTDTELCSEMATTSPNASCTFATGTPAIAGTYDYYAFIFDSHGLPAAPASRAGTYTINNAAPVLGTLVLNGGSAIILNIKDGGDTAVSAVNVSVEDLNGCHDLESAVGAIHMSNATSSYNCLADDNTCYQIEMADCALSACDSADDMIGTYTCTAYLKYFAVPTDSYYASNPWKNYNWLSYLNVFDGVNYAFATSAPVELQTNLAIEVPELWIDFGSGIFAGDNTGADNATTSVENAGNSPLDASIYGTSLGGYSYGGSIDVQWIKWNIDSFDYELETKYLKTSGQPVDLIAPRATATSTPSADVMYWGIGIPFEAYPDIYNGRNTFIAVLDEDDW